MQTFTFDYFLIALLFFFSLMIIILGFYLFLLDKKNKVFKMFFVFCCALAFWSISTIFQYLLFSTLTGKITMFFGLCVSLGFYLFSCFFPAEKEFSNKTKIILALYSIAGGVSCFTNLFITEVYQGVSRLEARFTPWFLFYGLFISGYFLFGFINITKSFKLKDKSKARQAKIFFLLWFLIACFAIFDNIFFPYIGIYWPTLLSPLISILAIIVFIFTISNWYFKNSKIIFSEILVITIFFVNLFNLFLFKSYWDLFLRMMILLILTVFGWFLIKSVKAEVISNNKAVFYNNKIKKANVGLKVLDEQKSQFISIASHQLRTPLTSIKGFISMILQGDFGKVLNDKVENVLSKVFESNERLIVLVNDLLNLAKIETGSIDYHLKKNNVVPIIEEVVSLFNIMAGQKKISLTFNKNQNIPEVIIDEQKIREVIFNLTDNAIKYTHEGNVVITAEYNKKENLVYVRVKDSGIGLSPSDMNKLFKQYSRATKENMSGCGIGLSIAKEIIDKHGQKIWVESEGKGKGSEFIFTLKEAE